MVSDPLASLRYQKGENMNKNENPREEDYNNNNSKKHDRTSSSSVEHCHVTDKLNYGSCDCEISTTETEASLGSCLDENPSVTLLSVISGPGIGIASKHEGRKGKEGNQHFGIIGRIVRRFFGNELIGAPKDESTLAADAHAAFRHRQYRMDVEKARRNARIKSLTAEREYYDADVAARRISLLEKIESSRAQMMSQAMIAMATHESNETSFTPAASRDQIVPLSLHCT